MSEIKVNKISPRSGTTLTLGDSGDDFVIPAGATLTNNGTASGFASIAWQSSIVTGSTLTAVAGNGYWIDTTSNACTITLPGSASVGDQIIFSDYARKWGTNAITINTNSLNFQGNTSPNPVYDTAGETVNIVYSGATKGWIPIDDGAVALETPQTVDIEYLVVAGGGGGGSGNAAGGGAGGLLTNYGVSTITLTLGEVYTVTVGAGASVTANPPEQDGANGSNSVLSGTGITTITAIGGGYGGNGNNQGGSGGSGGGNGYLVTSSGGSGTVGQGNDGGSGAGESAPAYGAAGGGGAGAVGGNGTSSVGGNGGVGLSNSITGSATFYAGGGGGGVNNNLPSAGSGGNGGGGAGSYNTGGTSGTANTGGGGGGGGSAGSGGGGGSGVVILRVPTADYSSTTTGSPTVTTDGTDTVIKFTGSGSYTA
jgi:hypothetical protein